MREKNTFDAARKMILQARRAVAFTGAGVSTSCGIPDFRGPRGLYSRVQELYDLPRPEALFDIRFFRKHPEVFYDFSRHMDLKALQPSGAHLFLSQWEKQGFLRQLVTQNIDGLHERAGSKQVVACHGTYDHGQCLQCRRVYSFDEYTGNLSRGEPRRCDSCGGLVKPDITFFGETLPQDFYHLMESPPEADFLLVLGTSLTVQPACLFPLIYLRRGIPSLLVNRDPTPYDDLFSLVIREDLDDFFRRISLDP